MNNFMYNPMAAGLQVAQQAADPMAVREQQMLNTGASAVYNNPMALNAAAGIYGSAQMRQNSVMMTQSQEEAFGPGGHSENPGLYKELK